MRTNHTSGADLQVAHTSELGRGTRQSVRALLDEVFGAAMNEHAWDHALGGMHALVWEARQLIAHGSVVQRRLFYEGRTLRAGYVEAVAVRADRRRCGYGAIVMDAVERIIHAAYEVGALGASQDGAGFYRRRGWSPWQGRTWALAPSGLTRTPEDDQDVYVLEVSVSLDVSRDLACDWREGDIW